MPILGKSGDCNIHGSTSARKTAGWLCPSIDTRFGATKRTSSSKVSKMTETQAIRQMDKLTKLHELRVPLTMLDRQSVQSIDLQQDASEGAHMVEGVWVAASVEKMAPGKPSLREIAVVGADTCVNCRLSVKGALNTTTDHKPWQG